MIGNLFGSDEKVGPAAKDEVIWPRHPGPGVNLRRPFIQGEQQRSSCIAGSSDRLSRHLCSTEKCTVYRQMRSSKIQ